ncbi:hypothetical protein ISF_05723 [Cordyceps fumosorosea ARSEF 2679]|uniref:Ankyrin 2,3/unc44 n=1 Tax=Cordyceps fumosorosea (strain ARSEF 2679) TaxID=1081104 RepID=A0A167TK56_CORFA|nr:hypothetical protein ISF_05723 [Cordyceps fumosorosea ARSEF 2679]OAA60684.1 hypothetical protein ISF_05723 [Cordyceps fumosorosea ARSEF 2679]
MVARPRQDLGHSLDLDYLNRRVCQLSNSKDAILPTVLEQVTTEQNADALSETQVGEDTATVSGTHAYHRLVDDGGRPLYSIDDLPQVLDNPNAYKERLRPYWGHPRTQFYESVNNIFQIQLARWREFRNWQLDNRGLNDPEDAFEVFVQEQRELLEKWGYLEKLAESDSDPSYFKKSWAQCQRKRRWQRRHQLEPDCDGFDDYKMAFEARLTRHGHLLPNLQLKENPRQQGTLTTWAEYLCFEYWWYDYYLERLKRLQPEYNRACAMFQDQGILGPGEGFISVDACATHLFAEINMSSAALVAARAKAKSACQSHTTATCAASHTCLAARKRLDDAESDYQRIFERQVRYGKFLEETRSYRQSQEDIEKHPCLIEWVEQQLLLIQTEMISTNPEPQGDSKRKRCFSDDPGSQMAGKYMAVEAAASGPSDLSTCTILVGTPPRRSPRFRGPNTPDNAVKMAPSEPSNLSTCTTLVGTPPRRILRPRGHKKLGHDGSVDTVEAAPSERSDLSTSTILVGSPPRQNVRPCVPDNDGSADAAEAVQQPRRNLRPRGPNMLGNDGPADTVEAVQRPRRNLRPRGPNMLGNDGPTDTAEVVQPQRHVLAYPVLGLRRSARIAKVQALRISAKVLAAITPCTKSLQAGRIRN